MRIAHIADLHLGRKMTKNVKQGENIRELDIYKAAIATANHLANTQPDLVVIAGDLWDYPNPTPLALNKAFDFIQIIREAQIPVVIIGGNHDTLTNIKKLTPLELLSRYFECKVAIYQEQFEIMGLNFICLPYRVLSSAKVDEFEYANDSANILIAHASAQHPSLDFITKYETTVLPKNILEDEKLNLSLLGHIHLHRKVTDNSYYSGALERLKWGEIKNEPSYYEHTIDEKTLNVETKSIQLKDLGYNLIPRPAKEIVIEGKNLKANELLDNTVSKLEEDNYEDHLIQIVLKNADPELYALNYNETVNSIAKKANIFDYKLKIEITTDDLFQYNLEHEQSANNNLVLVEQYKQFCQKRNEDDLIDLGTQIIGEIVDQSTNKS